VVGAAVAVGTSVSTAATPSAAPSPSRSTAKVIRTDLTAEERLDGTLGYGRARQLPAQRSGIVTALASEGQNLERGASLFTVDGIRAAILMYGAQPMWRDLGAGVSAGSDIEQLGQNLAAMGYAATGFSPSSHWTVELTAAVKAWQESLGLPETGRVVLGDVVFASGAVRIAGVNVALGATIAPGISIYAVTDTTPIVSVELPVSKQGRISVGQAVEVELPDATTASGTIRDLGTVAHTSGDPADAQGQGSPKATLTVIVDLSQPKAAGRFDQAPVVVRVVTLTHRDVLAVPVTALLARPEGGYEVERISPEGTELVAVDLGLFAGPSVEVSGNGLAAGDEVVVAP